MKKKEPSPYPFRRIEEIDGVSYEFQTEGGVRYRAYFSNYGYMFGSHNPGCSLYSFDLVVIGSLRPPPATPTDYRIADTVRQCFTELFAVISNVVVAVYDSLDNAQLARRRKFRHWFAQAQAPGIEMIDFKLDTEDYLLVSSVFIHSELASKERVLDLYQQVLEAGNIPLP